MAATKIIKVPSLCYGTAWKKDQTRALVHQALRAGFRGVDTAAQPKHYQEDLVGEGIRDAIRGGLVRREELYVCLKYEMSSQSILSAYSAQQIQTKYTSVHGQDPTQMPYKPKSSIPDQVAASIASSLRNLRAADDATDSYIDCLVLHSPFPNMKQTQEAWQAMERCVPTQARALGISNIYRIDDLETLWQSAKIPPSVVQNRFYPETHYDSSVREFCRAKGIVYQSFWTLTANPGLLRSEAVKKLAAEVGVSVEVGLYSLVLGLGEDMSVLDGTTNAGRMEEDLKGVEMVRAWAEKHAEGWSTALEAFRGSVD